MARIELNAVSKRYGHKAGAHQALDKVSLQVGEGEFVALLGPSGSGKTTLLRAIAGLETIDQGRIGIGEQAVAGPGIHVPPEQRHVSVVFQSHALWPHMTVLQNVRFPLEQARRPAAQAEAQALCALERVDLAALQGRYPAQLSGGQRQRVALARALVGQPRAILFDEPLASLDLELRRDMMRHIAQVREAGVSMVYVTHNQEEALALADRVAVLARGRLEQLDTPQDLWLRPATPMVAQFVGSGNLVPAQALEPAGDEAWWVQVGAQRLTARSLRGAQLRGAVQLSVAPAAWRLSDEGQPALRARADAVFYAGDHHLVEASVPDLGGLAISVRLPATARPTAGDWLPLIVDDAWVIPPARAAQAHAPTEATRPEPVAP